MNLNIFIVLLLTLFNGGYSLKCYECKGVMGFCESKETTCPSNETTCASVTMTVGGDTSFNVQAKACDVVKNCVNGSVNFGLAKTGVSMQCCNTDLCNSKDVPDYNSNRPNGKQCYYCDGKSCLKKLNCLGTEDFCITAKLASSQTVKGCVSKTICDGGSQATQDVVDFSCCQGYLCNSAMSITKNLLFLSWPFFFYILIH
nr:urokinase plasminogen activator surface receptor-like [Misgurnus anguillicaudatus]